MLPSQVRIVEVGPRDGLQNESQSIDLITKLNLINRLASAGLRSIEAGSFVNPQWVPQMAGSEAVFQQLDLQGEVTYTALTPNLKGLERALAVGVKEVAVFAAASEAFSQRNINCSIAESFSRFRPLVETALAHGLRVRGYISCVVGCPYEGSVAPVQVAKITEDLLALGCYEVSLGDTIGVGTPLQIRNLLDEVRKVSNTQQLALHLHDTYGQALANIYAGLLEGVSVFDASVAGLGGCPYAKGATGNVATEDLVYLLDGLGIAHGIDLDALIDAGVFITDMLGRANHSRAARALLAKRNA